MDFLTQLHRHQPLPFSSHSLRPSLPKPISSLSFRTPPSFQFKPIRASSSPPPILNPLSSPFLRTTCIAIASAALFFTRLHIKPSIAAPVTAPMVEPSNESTAAFEEEERALKERLTHNPHDVQALRSLAELRIQANKIVQAIEVIDLLIELQPQEPELPLLKCHLYTLSGDLESARQGFEELLEKDPLLIQPYLGLAALASEQGGSVKELTERAEAAMERCKKERTNSDVRDFKLLIAQLMVIQNYHNDALKLYQELVLEDPNDFRPYLCQGIIYTLLRKTDEAEKQFAKYRELVPKNHPFGEYFADNATTTRIFSKDMKS